MTEIAFHFNVSDKLDYLCRLLRKAFRSHSPVGVVAPGRLLAEADRRLWTFAPLEFVPHALVSSSTSPNLMKHTGIWFAHSAREVPHAAALVNLGDEVPEGFERFERLIEVVDTSSEDRGRGRQRWKHYADRGYEIKRHEVGG